MRAHSEVFSRIRIPIGSDESAVPVEVAAFSQVDGVIAKAAPRDEHPPMRPAFRLVILHEYLLAGFEYG